MEATAERAIRTNHRFCCMMYSKELMALLLNVAKEFQRDEKELIKNHLSGIMLCLLRHKKKKPESSAFRRIEQILPWQINKILVISKVSFGHEKQRLGHSWGMSDLVIFQLLKIMLRFSLQNVTYRGRQSSRKSSKHSPIYYSE